MKLYFLLLIFVIFTLETVRCDLPVHCLKHQVTGQWQLEITRPKHFDNFHDNTCGHSTPDSPATNYLAYQDQFSTYDTITVTLNRDDTVTPEDSDEASGTWTMLYDEGFEITLDNKKYMSFFYYEPNPQDPDNEAAFISNCGLTVVGWYHNLDDDTAACFRATRIMTAADNGEQEINIGDNIPTIQPALLIASKNTKTLKSMHKGGMEFLQLDREFVDHHKAVHQLNTFAKKSWHAEVPHHFHGKNIKELNQLAGRRNLKPSKASNPHVKELNRQDQQDVSDLPTEWDWTDVAGPIRNQQGCGSCYIFATTNMIASRLKIKYGEDVLLSVQHPLDCAYYNQGCEGGYPFLVNKYGSENQFVPESCHPYKGVDGQCSNSCDLDTLDKIYKVQSWGFVGGSYGRGNERDMMVELMNNGPFAVSFEPAYDFMYYKKGVYHSVPAADWILADAPHPEWEKVDHSVLLIGWGEDDGEKYWKLKNTWGQNWGENGTFRMRRGTDESGIESMPEAADPYIVYKCDAKERILLASQGSQECF